MEVQKLIDNRGWIILGCCLLFGLIYYGAKKLESKDGKMLGFSKLINKSKPKGFKLKELVKSFVPRKRSYPEPEDTSNKTLIGYKSSTPYYTNDHAKHVFICGTIGSGKTVALCNYIKRAIEKDFPLLIVDGKGDINNDSILDIVNGMKGDKKLYVINMTDPEHSDSYNPFKGANATVCKDMLINMSEWSEEHYKANTERYIERLVKIMTLSEITLSLSNITKFLPPKKLSLLSADLFHKDIISKDDHTDNLELIETSGSIAESASARFSRIHESEFGQVFKDDGIDIHQALEEKAIILFVLDPLSYPEMSPLIGKLVLIDAKKSVSKMFRSLMAERIFFIFDEVSVYASPTLIDLINKSRSANVTCIAATQSLADLEYAAGEAFKNQMIENCNNYLIMLQNTAKSADEWSNTIGTRQTVQWTMQVEQSGQSSTPTGKGTGTPGREYIFHPDDIKNLQTGEAFFLSKESKIHTKIKVNKPF